MDVSENVCPVCKTKNELEAILCIHCGAVLSGSPQGAGHKTKTTDLQAPTPEMIREWSLKSTKEAVIPESGIAIYVQGYADPAYIEARGEFVLGRKSGTTSGILLDLAPFGGYSLGLSRRHVAVQRTEDGYVIMDLGSVNGTFINEERLIPHKLYSLPSGSFVRLGRMQLFVLYRPSGENT